ncbi:MAG: hypothetical protein JXA14_19875 [Anaerolineae bacterium]|nr:hypothetical protein [Anaerolineae bacterium]
MDESKNTILVRTADAADVRKAGIRPRELKVDVLAENVNLFLVQVDQILQKAPEDVGKFKLTEFTVSAEISGKGELTLMGTGVEVGAQGGLTFKFERK